ncbi:PilZ domain-containing protein [Aestuariirhabdus litorea]|uniref:PilZ domain-containing protein n=1 Tax=Aestuariirhabdus litorea TaxID=2528527 RepID=A0A3P3VQT2_9GAMM|nr:PilZ domain-containing protein [Aestuariirhabdus litorea]RRJ84677.1 PilZ domain-containing protein [Aestuariirhabdus litorea]RWW97900.1 PilZ domain-containing protein [Endozoicomonadaceae bacterium GTF-13]
MDQDERRNFFRITDKVALEYQLIDLPLHPKESGFPYQHTGEAFSLASEIQSIETESQHILRAIHEDNRLVSQYLKSIDKRIQLLSRMVSAISFNSTNPELVEADLSEGGISIITDTSFAPSQYLAMKLTLFPSYAGIMATGRVLESIAQDGGYRHSIIFEEITEPDRQLLARHIIQYQALLRRHHVTQAEQDQK